MKTVTVSRGKWDEDSDVSVLETGTKAEFQLKCYFFVSRVHRDHCVSTQHFTAGAQSHHLRASYGFQMWTFLCILFSILLAIV